MTASAIPRGVGSGAQAWRAAKYKEPNENGRVFRPSRLKFSTTTAAQHMLRTRARSTLHGVVFAILCPGPAVRCRRGAARLFSTVRKTWMAGSSPAMTVREGKQKRPGLATQPFKTLDSLCSERAPHPDPLRASFARLDPARAGRGRSSNLSSPSRPVRACRPSSGSRASAPGRGATARRPWL